MDRRAKAIAIATTCLFGGCKSDERNDAGMAGEGVGLPATTNASASTGDVSDDDEDPGSGIRLDVGNGDTGGMGPAVQEDCNVLLATGRDFQASHIDFENESGTDPGMVEAMLGPDSKPVYAGDPTTKTTHGQEFFDQWYRDVDGVNVAIPIELELVEGDDGVFTFESNAFFPIDDDGFGNEGNPHNYHFTLELHTEFTYEGGEVFRFTGDDDLFTFINGRLGIDLGGVHSALTGEIDLDAVADEFGLEIGETYPLDFFFAERHTTASNFRIDTTISCFVPVTPG